MSVPPINEQVEEYLVTRPEFRAHVQRVGDGEYLIDGRQVQVGFCRQGFLVVHDGPLRQPFVDYVEKQESSAIYINSGLKNSALCSVSKESRVSFGDEGNRYSRLDAMKIAKEQAIFREKAAGYAKEGQVVPSELRDKYEKTIDIKLGNRREKPLLRPYARTESQPPQQPEPLPTGPAWWPGAPATATTVPAPPPPQPQQPPAQPLQPQNPQGPLQPMPALGPPQQPANLFGQVPDLFQIAAARQQQPSAPLGAGSLSVSAPPGASKLNAFASMGLKAPMGFGGPMRSRQMAGFCGA